MDRLTYIDIPESPWSSQISIAWPYSEVWCAVSTCKVSRSCVFLRDFKLLVDYDQLDFTLCKYYLWGMLQDAEFIWTVHALQKNWKIIFEEKLWIFQRTLRHVLGNILERCLETGSWHFEALIQSKAHWSEGTKWAPKFPADAGSVCGKVPMTASMHDGSTPCTIKL